MKVFLSILILLPSLCFSLTFKKDGSIISSSGEIKRESIAVRYQRALEQYNNGDEIIDWPTVKKTKNGKLDLDPSLVTSRAMAETLSYVASDVSNEVSSDPTSEPGYQAIDPNTGEAPKP